MSRVALASLAVAAAILAVSAALLYPEIPLPGRKAKRASGPPEKASLAYVATTHAVLAGVALEKGFFLDEGLEVTGRRHSFGRSAFDDLMAGQADFATVAEVPIMTAGLEGEKIFVLATIQTSNRYNAILARKDAGILKPEDLKGKRIAATLGTTSDFFMDAFLAEHGIARGDVEKVNLKPEQLQGALSGGRVDAVSTFQPYLIQMQKKLGDRAVSFQDENIYTWTFNLIARQELVRRNPCKVAKMLRALVRAEEFVNRDPAAAQKIIADLSGVAPSLVREIWPDLQIQVTLDQLLLLALEDEAQWAMHSGMAAMREIPNYLDSIYFDGLEAVKPEAVRILR